jgi:hypothetical protein
LKTASLDDVLVKLRAVRRRMLVQSFLTRLSGSALFLGALLVILGAVKRWLFGLPPWSAQLAAEGMAAAVVLSAVMTWFRRGTLPEAAAAIDRLAQTRDRFLTALDLSKEAPASGLRALALQECANFIRGGDFARMVRLRVPREVYYLLVPAVALSLLYWEARGTFGARAAQAATAEAEVEGTAQRLEELARAAEKADDRNLTEDLKKLAEEMKKSARQLRAEATTSEQAQKAALRELSELEKLVQEVQKQQSATPSPEELRELAKALEKEEQTRDAAAALNEGDLGRAAEQLEKAMKDLAEQGDERTSEQIERALQEALERLAEQKQLSEALEKLAKQRQQGGGQQGTSGQLSKELADLLRKLKPQNGQGQQTGSSQNAQSLKNLLAALQNLKFGEGQPNGKEPGPGEPRAGISMQNFGPNAKPGQGGDPDLPSGNPGSEHDTGTTASPYGKEQNPAGKDAVAQSVTGRLGEGETLQQFLPGVGDASKSKRRYKELYEAMAPAAEDAVVQENIPLGSRFFIKRYFESIRPRE